ncbi:hypothetical protein COO60DRAFT_593515 [Scenedesmus sp. NREL 46B-D3]|nr:hypothetical protein COO60DRAFT_593515 [Scenedesmus sp. NREL 46B-D3]
MIVDRALQLGGGHVRTCTPRVQPGRLQARVSCASARRRQPVAQSSGCAPAGTSQTGVTFQQRASQISYGSSRRSSVVAHAVQAPPAPAAAEELSRVFYDAGGITVVATKEATGYSVLVEAAEPRGMLLHWGVNEWEAPPQEQLPEGSTKVDDKAVQTHFKDGRSVWLHFPNQHAPERIVFVLKELSPENWINNGSCYSVQLQPPGIDKLIGRVLDCEADATHWSLKDRLVLVNDVLDGFAAAGVLC